MSRPAGRVQRLERGFWAAADLFTSRCLLSSSCCMASDIVGTSVSLHVK